MKKIISLLLVLAMALTLVACGGKTEAPAKPESKYINYAAFSLYFVSVYHRKTALATGFPVFFFQNRRVNLYNLESFPLLKHPIL